MGFNKIKFLKSVDKVVGKPLVYLLPSLYKSRRDMRVPAERILVIRPGGIGDAVLLLPAIRILKTLLPDTGIDILCEKRNFSIFQLSKEVGGLYLYDRDMELLKCLRNKYDIVIDTEQWHRLSAVVALLTGAPIRVGFNTNERVRVFTHTLPYSHDDYEVYSFLRLIEPLTESLDPGACWQESVFDPDKAFIEPTEEAVDRDVLATLKEALRRWSKGLVAISPGATVEERRWGGNRYGRVAERLTEEGYGILILGTGAEKGDAERILSFAEECVDLTGKTDLKAAAFILKNCRLFIGPDSGLLHIAYAVGTPTVSLFGSGIQKKWAPRGQRHIVINKGLPCSPCTRFGYTPKCKRGVACLAGIEVNEVFQSAMRLLGEDGG
jgi:lipopolysaccharide heptosyltransferase II